MHPDRAAADELLSKAAGHLRSAEAIIATDPDGAYLLVYDAARKAMAAILANEGLRSTSRGGHVAVYQAVRAQLDPPMGRALLPFDRMRRRRNGVEYSSSTQAPVTSDEVVEDTLKAKAIIDLAGRVLDQMSPF